MDQTIRDLISAANEIAFRKLLDADPVWVDIGRAVDLVPGMAGNMILHSGPPIEWERMSPPQKYGVAGGALYEGWTTTPEDVGHLVEKGEIVLQACHEHRTVGSMAGITTPSMWVYAVEERRFGGRSYCGVYEGRGKTLAFGCYEKETIERLRWMGERLGPILKRAVMNLKDGLPLKPILAKALHMGDECHNRYVASTLWYVDELMKSVLALELPKSEIEAVLHFMTGGHYNSFLTLSMAGCKAIADAAHGIPNSSLVTCMARNGTDFGIKVSGLGNHWFTAQAQRVQGLYFPGHGPEEANPDMGDSTITETVGLGGFALASAPATMQIVGKSFEEAIALVQEMGEITIGENESFTLPFLNFQGTPTGIDLLKVVETGITPNCVTAIASVHPNIGMIGAGIVRQPIGCFLEGLKALVGQMASRNP